MIQCLPIFLLMQLMKNYQQITRISSTLFSITKSQRLPTSMSSSLRLIHTDKDVKFAEKFPTPKSFTLEKLTHSPNYNDTSKEIIADKYIRIFPKAFRALLGVMLCSPCMLWLEVIPSNITASALLMSSVLIGAHVFCLSDLIDHMLSKSDNFNKFKQIPFNLKVRNSNQELNFPKLGCFGHTYIWNWCIKSGESYISNIKSIENSLDSNTPLTDKQKLFLKSILETQALQHHESQQTVTKQSYQNNATIAIIGEHYSLLDDLLHASNENPGELYAIFLHFAIRDYKYYFTQRKSLIFLPLPGHILGVTTTHQGEIHIYDSDFGEMVFNDFNEAKSHLAYYLTISYPLYNIASGARSNFFLPKQESATTTNPPQAEYTKGIRAS